MSPKLTTTDIEYPEFDHGEDLLVLLGKEKVEFRSEKRQWIRGDNCVCLEDEI